MPLVDATHRFSHFDPCPTSSIRSSPASHARTVSPSDVVDRAPPSSTSTTPTPVVQISFRQPSKPKSKFSSITIEKRTPRPSNAFMLYRSSLSKVLNPPGDVKRPQSEVSKLVGSLWRNEPSKIRAEWEQKARDVKVLHSIQYPGTSRSIPSLPISDNRSWHQISSLTKFFRFFF